MSSVILHTSRETKPLLPLSITLQSFSQRHGIFHSLGRDAEALISFAWSARPFFSCFSLLNKRLNHSSSTMRLTACSINNWKQEGSKSNKNQTWKCWNEIGYFGVVLLVFFKFSIREPALYKGKKKSHLLYLAGVSNACSASCNGPSLCHQLIFFKALYWSWDERILSWFDWMPARGIKFLHVGLL